MERKRLSEQARQIHADFMLWLDQKRQRVAAHEQGHALPPEIEEGGLVDPYMPEGRDQEIELFVAPGSLSEARNELRELQKPTVRPTYTAYPLGGGGHGIGKGERGS